MAATTTPQPRRSGAQPTQPLCPISVPQAPRGSPALGVLSRTHSVPTRDKVQSGQNRVRRNHLERPSPSVAHGRSGPPGPTPAPWSRGPGRVAASGPGLWPGLKISLKVTKGQRLSTVHPKPFLCLRVLPVASSPCPFSPFPPRLQQPSLTRSSSPSTQLGRNTEWRGGGGGARWCAAARALSFARAWHPTCPRAPPAGRGGAAGSSCPRAQCPQALLAGPGTRQDLAVGAPRPPRPPPRTPATLDPGGAAWGGCAPQWVRRPLTHGLCAAPTIDLVCLQPGPRRGSGSSLRRGPPAFRNRESVRNRAQEALGCGGAGAVRGEADRAGFDSQPEAPVGRGQPPASGSPSLKTGGNFIINPSPPGGPCQVPALKSVSLPFAVARNWPGYQGLGCPPRCWPDSFHYSH